MTSSEGNKRSCGKAQTYPTFGSAASPKRESAKPAPVLNPRCLRDIRKRDMRVMYAMRFALAAGVVVLLASPAGAAVKRWYWTPAQATAAAKTTATIPYCRIYECVNGHPFVSGDSPVPAHLETVSCAGRGAVIGGRYRQFLCKFGLINDIAFGQIMVYTSGPTAFRWKTICLKC